MKPFLIGLTLSAWAITAASMWANHRALELIDSQRELIALIQSRPLAITIHHDCREQASIHYE